MNLQVDRGEGVVRSDGTRVLEFRQHRLRCIYNSPAASYGLLIQGARRYLGGFQGFRW